MCSFIVRTLKALITSLVRFLTRHMLTRHQMTSLGIPERRWRLSLRGFRLWNEDCGVQLQLRSSHDEETHQQTIDTNQLIFFKVYFNRLWEKGERERQRERERKRALGEREREKASIGWEREIVFGCQFKSNVSLLFLFKGILWQVNTQQRG